MIPQEVRTMVDNTRSHLPMATFSTRTFDTWKWPGSNEDGIGHESLDNWMVIGKWEENALPFLFIYGPKGVGKTHLALSLGWNKLIGGNVQVVFYQVEAVMDEIRAGFESGISNHLIETIKRCDLMIFDDIGAQKLTEWSVAKLDSMIDYRYIECKPTIFTSNYSLDPQYADRIPVRVADRIKEGMIIRLRGESKRGSHN